MFARLRGFGARIWASGKSAASRAGWVDWAGLALIAVALVFVGVWKSGHLQEWAPNLATELASIAITIVVVDRIVQRERARRIRPRLESAFLAMNVAVDDFMRSVRLDYEAAGGTAELPWREDGLDALEGWRRHLQDTQAGSDPPGRHDTVVHAALDLSRVFSEIAARDGPILEPELVSAVHTFALYSEQLKGTFNRYVESVQTGTIAESRAAERNYLDGIGMMASLMLSEFDRCAQDFPVYVFAGGEPDPADNIPEGVPALRTFRSAHRVGVRRGLRYFADEGGDAD